MPRSSPSRADRELINELGEAGVAVTPYQLERWRRRGLLPRPTVTHHRRAGSTVEPHPFSTFRAAAILGSEAIRGLRWQDLTWHLVFEHLPVTQECLRQSAERAVLRPHNAVLRLWAEAVGRLPPSFVLDVEQLLQVSDLVVELAGTHRALKRELGFVTNEIRQANYLSQQSDIEKAGRVALGLRLALLAGAELPGELVQLARYGIEHPPAHRPVLFALPSDKLAAARSLTHPETDIAVDWIQGLATVDALTDQDLDRDPLELVTTEVALRRLNSPPWFDASDPLDAAGLQSWSDEVSERLDLRENPGQELLPFDS